jgi:tetratricopeptide (TPR) repeat protein
MEKFGSYDEALEALKSNNPPLSVVDLRQIELSKEQFEELKQAIGNNPTIGYIYWGTILGNCEQLKEVTEEKLIKNIYTYIYHPNDYIHGLLAKHVCGNPQQSQELDLYALSQELGHELPVTTSRNWKVAQVKYDNSITDCLSALYVNEVKQQAVLSFKGILFKTSCDLKVYIDAVIGNHITEQEALVYEATKAAVEYIKEKKINLSITGYSLGGYLAELAVVFCYRDFKYRQVKGIVFDSPGTVNKLNKFKPNVINKDTEFSIAGLPIVSYLSAPNLINTCDAHPGEVYRVYPQLKAIDWLKQCEAKVSRISIVSKSIQVANKWLLVMTSHNLETILSVFNPITGKPREYVRVSDWPKLNINNLSYTGKKGSLWSTVCAMVTNIIGLPRCIGRKLGALLGSNIISERLSFISSIAGLLLDSTKIDGSQYWQALEYLNEEEGYRKNNLLTRDEFKLKYVGHYQESPLKPNECILYIEQAKSIDWYLYELDKYRDLFNKLGSKDFTTKLLKSILGDYRVVTAERTYLILEETCNYIEHLWYRIQRALAILPPGSIDKVMEEIKNTNVKGCVPYLQKLLISKLSDYIILAKLNCYVFKRNKYTELANGLLQAGVCVIYGHGGVGKSTMAAEYGYEQKKQQVIIRWINAETGKILLQGYEILARELAIDYDWITQAYKEDLDKYISELARFIYDKFSQLNQSILFILDNAIDPILIDACLLHRTHLAQFIVTTRNDRGFNNYNRVKLSAFDKEEGEKYVKGYLDVSLCQPSEKEIQSLINEVGLIPKNLALAVGYINTRKLLTVKAYIQELQEYKKSGSKERGSFILPEAALGLETLVIPAQLIMRYGAYLDPDFIPLTLVSELLHVEDKELLEDILADLEGLSLITVMKGENDMFGIQIHREVQAECKQYRGWSGEANVDARELFLSLIRVLYQYMLEIADVPNSTWGIGRIYANSVAYILSYMGEDIEENSLFADLLGLMGTYSSKVECNYQQALKYYARSLRIYQLLYTGNHPDIATSFSRVGDAYDAVGNPQEALQYFKKALTMNQALYTDNHSDIAVSFNNVGNVYQSLGQFQEALKYYEKALAMFQELYPYNYPTIAIVLNNISGVCNALGYPQEALQYCLRSLEIKRRLYVNQHSDIAISLNNIGSIYQNLGQFQKALRYYEEAFKMRRVLYTESHPDTASSLNNMGGIYQHLGQLQEALTYYKQSLAMYRKLYINNHPIIAVLFNNIGNVYHNLGQLRSALKYYNRSLRMKQILFKGNHPDVVVSLDNIGCVYQSLGKFKKALKYCRQALKMWRALYADNHPDTAISLNNMGGIYQNLGQLQKALGYYEKALKMRQDLYKGKHPDIANSLNNVGNVYDVLGQTQKALKYYEQSLEIYLALYNTDSHPDIANLLNNFGSAHYKLSQFQEALSYYEKSIKMYHNLYGDNHPHVFRSLINIGCVYNALRKPQEALSYYEKSLKMSRILYPGDHPNIASLLNSIGGTYWQLKQFQEALDHLHQALEMNERLYGDNHPHIAASLDNIGMFYKTLGGYQEALKYFNLALTMYRQIYTDAGDHPHIQMVKQNISEIQRYIANED